MRKAKNKTTNQVLAKNRANTDRIAAACLAVAMDRLSKPGTHAHFEWPVRCHGWSHCAPVRAFKLWLQQQDIKFYKVRIDACVWGMTNIAGTQLMGKRSLSAADC